MRWGRFQGLLFAPEKRVKHAFGRRVERAAGGWCGKPGACLAADWPLAPQTGASFRGIAWAHCLGAPGGRIVWAANRAKPPSAKPPDPAQPSPATSPAAPGFRCRPRSQAYADFATGLIAAKPEKPCDRAVFGAFYLLLKKERKRADTPALLRPVPSALSHPRQAFEQALRTHPPQARFSPPCCTG